MSSDHTLTSADSEPASAVSSAARVEQEASTDLPFVRRVTDLLLRFGMLIVLVGLMIAAQVVYPEFLTWRNLQNTITQNSNTAIVAVGATYVMIGGGFDLSVAGTLGLGSVIFAELTVKGLPVGLALILALFGGTVAGIFNGLVITKLKVNPFVATLGSAAIFLGIGALYANSDSISVPPSTAFTYLGQSKIAGVDVSVILIVILYVLGGFVLSRTVFGRSVYATGNNHEAARLAGIRVDRVQTLTFAISGLLAALAGVVLASSLVTGGFDQGTGVELNSIAGVVIGGTSLWGGEGAMWRTAVGCAILATLNNLFSSLAIAGPTQSIITGGFLILAVAFVALQRFQRR